MPDHTAGPTASGAASAAGESSDERAVYVISVAAELTGLHPQTLRGYDRMGLVSPSRAAGRGRRYSERDVERLREVALLSQAGVNLAGVQRVMELRNQVDALQSRLAEIADELAAARADAEAREAAAHASHRRELVPLRNAVVVWQPHRRR